MFPPDGGLLCHRYTKPDVSAASFVPKREWYKNHHFVRGTTYLTSCIFVEQISLGEKQSGPAMIIYIRMDVCFACQRRQQQLEQKRSDLTPSLVFAWCFLISCYLLSASLSFYPYYFHPTRGEVIFAVKREKKL